MDWRNSFGPRNSIQDLNRILLDSEKYSDVTFHVGPEKVPIKSHKFILMTRSSVFEVMFGEPWMSTSGTDIEIPDANPETFKDFLRFLYTNNMDEMQSPIELIYLAQKYCIPELTTFCSRVLKVGMELETAIAVYQASKMFDQVDLSSYAMEYMLKNATGLVLQEEFLKLDVDTLCDLIGNSNFCINEVDLFVAVKAWSKAECERQNLAHNKENMRKVLERVTPLIRFPLMSAEEFSAHVVRSGVLNKQEIILLFMHLNLSSDKMKQDIPPLPYDSTPRASGEPRPQTSGRSSMLPSKFSVGLYLCEETCGRDALTYRFGVHGKIHDEDLNFSVNRPIHILGFGLYGPGQIGHMERRPFRKYEVDIALYTLSKENPRVFLSEVSRTVTTRDDFEVHFQHPVKIHQERIYHVRLAFRGEETKHGISRLSHVNANSRGEMVSFAFLGPFGPGPYGQPDGRIRSIIFNV